MRPLTSSELLDVWEKGCDRPSYDRALFLLSAASPDESYEELAKLSIGSRDIRLLTLREWTFGSLLTGVSACPACKIQVELTADVPELRGDYAEYRDESFQMDAENYTVNFRLPCTFDLKEIDAISKGEDKRLDLLRRCILDVQYGNQSIAMDHLPPHVLNEIISQIAHHDPQADIQFSLSCPACGHTWQSVFDIVSFFWSEIQAWAVRIVRDVHALASTYGWSEADILSMSPLRRQMYLNMVQV